MSRVARVVGLALPFVIVACGGGTTSTTAEDKAANTQYVKDNIVVYEDPARSNTCYILYPRSSSVQLQCIDND